MRSASWRNPSTCLGNDSLAAPTSARWRRAPAASPCRRRCTRGVAWARAVSAGRSTSAAMRSARAARSAARSISLGPQMPLGGDAEEVGNEERSVDALERRGCDVEVVASAAVPTGNPEQRVQRRGVGTLAPLAEPVARARPVRRTVAAPARRRPTRVRASASRAVHSKVAQWSARSAAISMARARATSRRLDVAAPRLDEAETPLVLDRPRGEDVQRAEFVEQPGRAVHVDFEVGEAARRFEQRLQVGLGESSMSRTARSIRARARGMSPHPQW